MSKHASAKGSGPGGAWTKLVLSGQALARGMRASRLDDRLLDVEARGMGGAVAGDQMQRDAACPAADVEHRLALERQPFQHAVDFVGSAGRQITLAPQRLQEADGRVVIFRFGVGVFDHLGSWFLQPQTS